MVGLMRGKVRDGPETMQRLWCRGLRHARPHLWELLYSTPLLCDFHFLGALCLVGS